ncbi:hypothetical protein [Glycomyces rhizosphaerae]|uniref:Secreted protein n=1 Tax=Glycomyces rhizosphaerae TaxID=2054422 RepID=A0ABV7Q055_9ACTN
MGRNTISARHWLPAVKKRTLTALILGAVGTLALALAGPASAAAPTVAYTGQGFIVDTDGTPNLKDERCGLTGQNDADDGGTGLFADWNGPGRSYEAGQSYLVWVLTLNANPSGGVTLHLPDGEVPMVKIGGTWKFAGDYYAYEDLLELPVHATFNTAGIKPTSLKQVNLVVSHGCQEMTGEGAWCSPGYWRNASDASWALTGVARTDRFNATVVPGYYDTASAADPTLTQVLTTPGANTYGAASAPHGLNAFNATGAFLTDQIPGYSFDPARMAQEDACPIDNHGNFKD